MSYTSIAGFEHVYLEDSFVLDIEAHPGFVVFVIDVVLTSEHPAYRAPSTNEQYCYERGRIEFHDVTRLSWDRQGTPPAHDASGEIDFGNIDSFQVDSGRFSLEGDWGRMEVDASPPSMTFLAQ